MRRYKIVRYRAISSYVDNYGFKEVMKHFLSGGATFQSTTPFGLLCFALIDRKVRIAGKFEIPGLLRIAYVQISTLIAYII